MRISYSALDTFKRCPLKFKFQYIDKIKTPKSKNAIFGTLVHSALKMLHDPGPNIPTEEEFLQYFANKWDSSIYESEQESILVFAQAIKILKDYYAKNYPANFNVVALEIPFESPIIINNETHFITGKIDRIDKNLDGLFEVIDYKTAKKMPSQDSIENNLQLSVYHLGVANRWPSIIKESRSIKVSLYFLKHGEILSSTRTPENLEETKNDITKTFAEIDRANKDRKFDATPNALCDWCEHQKLCPYFRHKFIKEKIFFNDQDINLLLNEYLSLKDEVDKKDERMNEIKLSLIEFMNQEKLERLFSETGYLTSQIRQTFKYAPEIIKEILEPLGRWEEVLKLDDAKIKKIAKELSLALRQKIDSARKLEKESKTYLVKKEKSK